MSTLPMILTDSLENCQGIRNKMKRSIKIYSKVRVFIFVEFYQPQKTIPQKKVSPFRLWGKPLTTIQKGERILRLNLVHKIVRLGTLIFSKRRGRWFAGKLGGFRGVKKCPESEVQPFNDINSAELNPWDFQRFLRWTTTEIGTKIWSYKHKYLKAENQWVFVGVSQKLT